MDQVIKSRWKHKEYGFDVISNWKGYDFDAYLRKEVDDSDVGLLQLSFIKGSQDILAQFKVEVKSTQSNSVTMSLLQANTAVDNNEIYFLCVVETNQIIEDLIMLINKKKVVLSVFPDVR